MKYFITAKDKYKYDSHIKRKIKWLSIKYASKVLKERMEK